MFRFKTDFPSSYIMCASWLWTCQLCSEGQTPVVMLDPSAPSWWQMHLLVPIILLMLSVHILLLFFDVIDVVYVVLRRC